MFSQLAIIRLVPLVSQTHTFMKQYPIALSIAGSDSSGGAGIQADLKAISALGVYGATVITAITAQNTKGVSAIQGILPEIIEAQGEAVLNDLNVDAIKIGMLHSIPVIESVGRLLSAYPNIPVVVDPVMVATSGDRLLEDGSLDAYRNLIFPHTTILTPNLEEAALLADMKIDSIDDMLAAGKIILKQGCKAVIIKGGHLSSEVKTDILIREGNEPVFLNADNIKTENTHGTGCSLSASIAACIAKGADLETACQEAKEYLHNALKAGADFKIGHGHGPVNHFFNPIPLTSKN